VAVQSRDVSGRDANLQCVKSPRISENELDAKHKGPASTDHTEISASASRDDPLTEAALAPSILYAHYVSGRDLIDLFIPEDEADNSRFVATAGCSDSPGPFSTRDESWWISPQDENLQLRNRSILLQATYFHPTARSATCAAPLASDLRIIQYLPLNFIHCCHSNRLDSLSSHINREGGSTLKVKTPYGISESELGAKHTTLARINPSS